ncbi:MAG: hypothetical protein ACTHN8_11055 [Angustibacter sp.]
MELIDFINAGLLFLTVLGGSVTLHSGVYSLLLLWQADLNDAAALDGLGFAVDSGVLFGVLFGLPVAAFLAGARAAGMEIG